MKLPKGYLSWSQMSLWERSKKAYIDQYVHGKPMYVTPEMEFGQAFAKAVELYGLVHSEWDEIISRLPIRSHREAELTLEYKGIPLLAGYDSCDRIGFEEYKTGRTPWDLDRVSEHGQIDFYALMFREEVGTIPVMALHWLPTQKQGRKISLTGDIHTFNTLRTDEQLDAFGDRIIRVASEISEAISKL